MDFSMAGNQLITSSDDDSIHIYDPLEGRFCMQNAVDHAEGGSAVRTLYSKKYGVSNIKFTHSGSTVLHASTKENGARPRRASLADAPQT